MPTLRSALSDLAANFASDILDVIRRSSLQELLGESGRRPRDSAEPSVARAAGATKSGRLPRRSAEEIASALDKVVGLVKKHKDGLRAEEIRITLGMQAKEIPRVLKEGLATKKLKCKGQKRATTYSAA
jgi:hypothetical protein